MENARLASAADLAAIEAVADRVAVELAPGRGGELFLAQEAARGSPADRVTRALARGDAGRAVVGCYDGVVLGFGLATIETLADGRRLGVIEALAVDPEARGVGIGEAMMNLLLSELREAGCLGADSRALPGDRETKNFFESFGLKARLLVVHQRFDNLDSPDAPA
jgi:ribosomal protein S18 acetylase RimI-like enzyme